MFFRLVAEIIEMTLILHISIDVPCLDEIEQRVSVGKTELRSLAVIGDEQIIMPFK